MISRSPYGDKFEYDIDIDRENKKIDDFINDRQTVVVQGLGFVGSAMVAALVEARNTRNELIYNVIAVDLPDEKNYWKIARVNNGDSPIVSSDKKIDIAYQNAYKNGNILATYGEYSYSKADVLVVDIHLDVSKGVPGDAYEYSFTYDTFRKSIEVVANNISPETLCIIETTVPPGTTAKVVYPIFAEAFKNRQLDINKLYLAHSYERVMPGQNYLDSIINFYRVYSGINEESSAKAEEFLESFINTEAYPLCKLHSTTASEMSKVLENSFRAMNIAFVQEWTRFAQDAGVDLFEVINAIRVRPTHKNIMMPGFGVGGYCLSKDPLLADWSYRNLFNADNHLKMSVESVAVNDLMPEYTFDLLKREFECLKDKHITILGISYLNDVADTRCSPAELFYDKCCAEGATMNLHDPLVTSWQEKDLQIDSDINHLKHKRHDVAVFAVRHKQYLDLTADDISSILPGVKVIIDANNIVGNCIAKKLLDKGIQIVCVGKGNLERLECCNE
ncbi:nucleotide sugar dehydrogenase [Candidatus Pacearchaeota archaeon]|nr:nucleotide sugar dehydrogenase [Candidatus Pacearchaeota archaeon]